MKCIIDGSKYEAILKMLLMNLIEQLARLGGLDIPFFFFLGTGSDFYQQLKLDFSRHSSESS